MRRSQLSTSSGLSVRGEGAERRDPEAASLDRGPLEDQTRCGIEAIEPRCEQRLQGRGDLDLGVVRAHPPTVDEESLIGEHRRELLQVQGVPLGRLADPVDDGRWGLRPEQKTRHLPGILRRERRKGRGERSRLAGRPGGTLLEELGPREAQEEHGTMNPLDDGIGQVEHRRLCPVDVFEHHDERLLRGEDLDQAPDRPGGVGRERFADPKDLGEAIAHGGAVGLTDQPFAERRSRPRSASPPGRPAAWDSSSTSGANVTPSP